LQIGLLVIGAAAVAGVLVYNRVQERGTRREAEQAFGSKHADVLLNEPTERREPTLQDPSDPRIDYVLELQGVSAAAVRSEWAALERRFAPRAAFTQAEGRSLHAALQMVSRNGVIGEAELLAFRSQVESIAAAQGASVSAPPMREALEAAQRLDRACADLDVQIALHVLGAAGTGLKSEGSEGFAVAARADGVTLLLDIPRTPDLARSYAAMVKAARRLGGRVVDDNGNALDERALDAIGVEVEALRARLVEMGIEPGSPLAQRLFS
jgi:hypothetical protein